MYRDDRGAAFFDGIATLAGRRKGRIDVLSPLGKTWCFLEWDGQRSVDGLGRYSWLIHAWREHEVRVKYSKRNVQLADQICVFSLGLVLDPSSGKN
jgi:hypothetical protein